MVNMPTELRFAQKGLVLNKAMDSLLLIRYGSAKFKSSVVGKYALPGGKVDPNEDLEIACVREIQEETGVCVIPGYPVYSYSFLVHKPAGITRIILTARLCMYKSGKLLAKKKEAESVIDTIAWIKLKDISLKDVVSNEVPPIRFVLENQKLAKSIMKIPYVAA